MGVSETKALLPVNSRGRGAGWATGRRSSGAGGAPGAASDGLRSAKNPAVREAPQPWRNSGLPVRLLRRLVVCPVVSDFALITERLSPKHLALPVGRSATASVRASAPGDAREAGARPPALAQAVLRADERARSLALGHGRPVQRLTGADNGVLSDAPPTKIR
jgi:hypothetical protein